MHEPPSKSALKRQAHRLQKLGLALTDLKPDVLANMSLPDQLREAIQVRQRISSREGGRRQMQYIGRLMRTIDTESIEQQLATINNQSASAKGRFHALERWRDKLILDPSAITAFIHDYPSVDRQQLRQLVNKAASTRPEGDDPTSDQHRQAARTLFKFIRNHGEQNP